MTENEISKVILDAAIEVHREMGVPDCWKIFMRRRWRKNFACVKSPLIASFRCVSCIKVASCESPSGST